MLRCSLVYLVLAPSVTTLGLLNPFLVSRHLISDCYLLQSVASLLRPFGMCAEFLNPEVIRTILATGMERAIKYVQNLEEKDFKEKVGSLIKFTLRLLITTKCHTLWVVCLL